MSEWDIIIPLGLVLGPFTALVIGLAGTMLGVVGLVDRQPPTFSVGLAVLWLPTCVIWLGVCHVLAPFWAFNVDGIDGLNLATVVVAAVWVTVAVVRTRFAPG